MNLYFHRYHLVTADRRVGGSDENRAGLFIFQKPKADEENVRMIQSLSS